MTKYGRNYTLTVQKRDGTTLIVKPPFTVEFDIHRNSYSSANTCSLRVYNLAPITRDQIRYDWTDFGDLRKITFAAGYGNNLSLAFVGNLSQAWSTREGQNIITQIECFDAGFAYTNAVANQLFPANTQNETVLEALISSLPGGVTVGAIGPSFGGQITRGMAVTGSTISRLNELTTGTGGTPGFFIDNLIGNCLSDSECLGGNVPLISANTGLLGTPLLENRYIHVELLFEPSLRIAQQVELLSQVSNRFNGEHKILAIKHRGMISEAVCGEAVTSLTLLPGVFSPVALSVGV